MDLKVAFGLHIFQKERRDDQSLKTMLQLIKSQGPGRSLSFAYVDGQTPLIPHISLWENLQLVVGGSNWKEFEQNVSPEFKHLLALISNPDIPAQKAESWEIFIISLLKALLSPCKTIIIDMNEDLLSPLMVMNFKKVFIQAALDRQVYLASAAPSIWLDCAMTLIQKINYQFSIQNLNSEEVKRHWVA